MAKKQTRRSISINRALYRIAKQAAEFAEVPLSQFTELALRRAIETQSKAVSDLVESVGAKSVSELCDIARVTP